MLIWPLGVKKKIKNKFPTLPPRAGGVLEWGKIQNFFFFFFWNLPLGTPKPKSFGMLITHM